MKTRISLPILFLLSTSWNLAFSQIYVNQAATGSNTGTSWEDAYTDLKSTLLDAAENSEIWVAAGTYRAGDEGTDPITTNFYFGKKLRLYGGFAGTETSLDERDISANETILNGDLSGDDIPGNFEVNRSDNGIHVLLLSTQAGGSIVDGFTIEHGSAKIGTVPTGADWTEWRGGGIFALSTCYIRNCTFRENRAGWGSACNINGNSFAYVENCLFTENNGERGTLSLVAHNNANVIDCDFINNHASEWGAGMNLGNSNCLIKGCNFIDNVAVNALGGAVFMWQNSGTAFPSPKVTLEDCTFAGNQAPIGGGLAMNNFYIGSRVVIDGCTFEHNVATSGSFTSFGGGISLNNYNTSSGAPPSLDVRMYRTRFEGNSAESTGGAEIFSAINKLTVEVDSCSFVGNQTELEGAGLTIFATAGTLSSELSNLTFIDNASQFGAGGLYVENSAFQGSQELTLTDSWFESNTTDQFGGGLFVKSGNASISGCTLQNNQAIGGGGGAHLSDCTAQLLNCEFAGNGTDTITYAGGGLSLVNIGPSTVERSTFHDNFSTGHGSALYLENSEALLLLENVAIWENEGLSSISSNEDLSLRNVTLMGNTNGLWHYGNSELSLQNSIFAEDGLNYQSDGTSTVTTLGGNLSNDNSMNAILVGASGFPDLNSTDPLLDTDLVPLPESPCVDAGNPTGIDPAALDAAGNPRFIGAGIDIGAYESGFTNFARQVSAMDINLSPNPATDFIRLQLPEAISGPKQISLFDPQGRLVEQRTFSEGQAIPVGHLTTGFYTLRLSDGEQVYIGRFVKQ